MLFKSTAEKNYNLEYKISKKEKDLIKKYNTLDIEKIDNLVSFIADWHITTFARSSGVLYPDKDVLKMVEEDKKLLMDIFNINKLYKELNNSKETVMFINNDSFRRKVMRVVLDKIILMNKENGAEYGLIFAKTFNFDYAIPMHYVYATDIFDTKFINFLKTYISIGGSDNTYWLPNYYDDNSKNRYSMEGLKEIKTQLINYIDSIKVNSKN